MKQNLFATLKLQDNTDISQRKQNVSVGLMQRKYTAVMQKAQTLLHQNLINEASIYDDLNCGKLSKMITFRVKEISDYAERLRDDQENSVSGNCHCCHR